MTRRILTYYIIGFLVIFALFETDQLSRVHLDWNSYHFSMPFAGFLLGILLFTALICLLNQLLHKLVHKQIDEAFALSDSETDDSLSIAQLTSNGEKLVLERKDIDNAMMLLLKAMTSITAGDMTAARENLEALRQIIGHDTIIDVLTLKIYKGEKDFDKMEDLSSKLMNNPNLELVSMKASLEAQMQKKEFEQALATANKAFDVRQDLYWVIESAFNLRAKANDWEGALEVLNAGFKKELMTEEKYNYLKSVTLYQIATEAKEHGDSTNFFRFCTQASDINNTLVPAALALAEYYVENDNQVGKAAKILNRTWRCNPTAEIAEAYLNLWPNDTPIERIQRMEALALSNAVRPSLNNLLLADLDVKAGLWGKAKSEFEIFLINNPMTKRLAKIIAEYEKKSGSQSDFTENWNTEENDFAQDGVWCCETCGKTSNKWQPSCKKCGNIGSFRWHLYMKK